MLCSGKARNKLSERKAKSKKSVKERAPPKNDGNKEEGKDTLKTNCFAEPYELIYNVPTNDKMFKAVSIINPDKHKMIFKFKCNNRKNFTVHTVYGYVLPLGASSTMITCKPLDKSSCAKNNKITIVLAHKTDDMPANEPANCWDVSQPWAPKKIASITVAIRYDLDTGEIIGGFTDEERARVRNEHMNKCKLIGGIQNVKKLHEQAALACIQQHMKEGDREQAKKELAADLQGKEGQNKVAQQAKQEQEEIKKREQEEIKKREQEEIKKREQEEIKKREQEEIKKREQEEIKKRQQEEIKKREQEEIKKREKQKRGSATSTKSKKGEKTKDQKKVLAAPVETKKKDADREKKKKSSVTDQKAAEEEDPAKLLEAPATVCLDDKTYDDDEKDKASLHDQVGPDEVMIGNKKYKKMQVPVNEWFETFRLP